MGVSCSCREGTGTRTELDYSINDSTTTTDLGLTESAVRYRIIGLNSSETLDVSSKTTLASMFSTRSSSICTTSGGDRSRLTQRRPLGELSVTPDGDLVPLIEDSDHDTEVRGEQEARPVEMQGAGEVGNPFVAYEDESA